MSVTARTGIWIGVLCTVWTFIMGFAGWYKDPALLNLFWVVVAIEVGLLIWGLQQTSGENGYWQQVGAGTVMAVIAAVIIFAGSLLFTAVVFPDYFTELQALQTQRLQASGLSQAEIEAAIALSARMQTPVVNAISGAIGTVVTGFVASLVIAVFCRKK